MGSGAELERGWMGVRQGQIWRSNRKSRCTSGFGRTSIQQEGCVNEGSQGVELEGAEVAEVSGG